MREVLLALIPAVIAYVWFFGPGLLINIAIAVVTALTAEAAMLRLREKPLRPFLGDGSALVTGVLLALALPPLTPWWITVIGVGFGIIVAKHLYGGLGANPFNPAMAGYVVLLVSFPVEMTVWIAPGTEPQTLSLIDTVLFVFAGSLPAGLGLDAITQATPLDTIKTGLSNMRMVTEIRASPLFGDFGGRGWEWINNFVALGGLFLLWRRIISWHIPVSMLGSLLVLAAVFNMLDPERFPSAGFHLFSGAALLGAFFIATDPVSAATSNRGRLIYGAGIGVLTYVIRTWGGYPDGVAFAVLLMNMSVPVIDHYTVPKAFGYGR